MQLHYTSKRDTQHRYVIIIIIVKERRDVLDRFVALAIYPNPLYNNNIWCV